MNHWLLKTEPGDYSFADLQRAGRTTWDGVANALALKHLRTIKQGDNCLIYHTGKERAAVGTATATADAAGDPPVFDIEPNQPLARPVTLTEMKADAALEGWDLLRLARLSVVPTTKAQYDRVLTLAGQKQSL